MPRKEYEPQLFAQHIRVLEETKDWDYESAKEFAIAARVPVRAVIAKINTLPGCSYQKKKPYQRKTSGASLEDLAKRIESIIGSDLPGLRRSNKNELQIILEHLEKNG